jgi:hypothetical protein
VRREKLPIAIPSTAIRTLFFGNLGLQWLTLHDLERLQAISGLTNDYLQLNSTPPEILRYFDGLERDRAGFEPPQSS